MMHATMIALALVTFALLVGFVEVTDRLTGEETNEPRGPRS